MPFAFTPNAMVPLAMFGWLVVAPLLFRLLTPVRAAFVVYLGAWLFLPVYEYHVEGLPNFGKMSVAAAGSVIGVLLFDRARIAKLRLRWIDLPVLVWCATPMISALANGQTLWDGISGVTKVAIDWMIPYAMGRLYLSDWEGVRQASGVILCAGLVYAPLCLLEIRLSPQLHAWVYGYHAASHHLAVRFGGYRPTVFTHHGIAVGMFMAVAALVASAAMRNRAWLGRKLANPSLAVGLFAVTLACKSLGAIALLLVGYVVLLLRKTPLSRMALLAVIALPLLYMAARVTGSYDAEGVIEAAALINTERSRSLEYRVFAEEALIARALERPIIGWSGWGQNRIRDENGQDMIATDGMWVITFGAYGAVGLVALAGLILLPAVRFALVCPSAAWPRGPALCALALSLLLPLWMIDCLMNSMHNPIFPMVAGGLGVLPCRSAARDRNRASAGGARAGPAGIRRYPLGRQGAVPSRDLAPS